MGLSVVFVMVMLSGSPGESVCDHQCVRASPGQCVSSSAEWSLPPNGQEVSRLVSLWSSHVSVSSPWLHCTSSLWKAEAQWRSARSPQGLFGLSADEIHKKEMGESLLIMDGQSEKVTWFCGQKHGSGTWVRQHYTYFNWFHSLSEILPLFNSLVNPLLGFVQCRTKLFL